MSLAMSNQTKPLHKETSTTVGSVKTVTVTFF